MNLTDMITLVRRDLKDETTPYGWSDDELTRHIERALKELSERVPLPAMALLPTTADSREVDISSLEDRIMVQAVEYPVDEFPIRYQRFSVWGDTVTLISGDVPNGGNCQVYYGTVHVLNAADSTIPMKHEDIVTAGAAGYAAIEMAAYAINRVNIGGKSTPREYHLWGNARLETFKDRLKRLGRRNRLRSSYLYNE